jgi:hypothetical protein
MKRFLTQGKRRDPKEGSQPDPVAKLKVIIPDEGKDK